MLKYARYAILTRFAIIKLVKHWEAKSGFRSLLSHWPIHSVCSREGSRKSSLEMGKRLFPLRGKSYWGCVWNPKCQFLLLHVYICPLPVNEINKWKTATLNFCFPSTGCVKHTKVPAIKYFLLKDFISMPQHFSTICWRDHTGTVLCYARLGIFLELFCKGLSCMTEEWSVLHWDWHQVINGSWKKLSQQVYGRKILVDRKKNPNEQQELRF